MLQQCICDHWQPISYFSKKLKLSETKYNTFDRELLAVYSSIKYFQHFVEGHVFHILTDHKPLTYSVSLHFDHYTPRQIRQLNYVSQFTSDIGYIKGDNNTPADDLSQMGVDSVLQEGTPIVDFKEMATAQQQDPDVLKLQTSPSSLTLKSYALFLCLMVKLFCDLSTGIPHPIVPSSYRRKVFDSLHSVSHPGVRATQRLITSHFIWPNINSDVQNWARARIQCQKSKIHRHTVTPFSTFATPDNQFDQVHIDLVDLYHNLKAALTLSLSLTDLHVGQKPFPS